MSTTVITQGGTPVWDSYGDWIDLVEELGGFICRIDIDTYYTRAKKTPWTKEEVKAFEDEIKAEYEIDEFDSETYVTEA